MGGARGSAERRYGNLDDIAWYADNSGRKRIDGNHIDWLGYRRILLANGNAPRPVDRKLPNSWGSFDMLGNIPQWVEDWYDKDYYKRSPSKDTSGPENPGSQRAERAYRGGSWEFFAQDVRVSVRNPRVPGTPDQLIGVRCVGDASSLPGKPVK
jgi:formylglycine-generating enzyme required for sulfatase activity